MQALDQSQYILPAVINACDIGLANFMDGRIFGRKAAPANGVTGIANYASVPSVLASGANAKTDLDYEHITKVRAQARGNNMSGAPCWVMRPGPKEKLERSPRLAGSTGNVSDAIISHAGMEMSIDGDPLVVDTNIPTDFVKGTTQDATALVYGNLADVRVGLFSEAEFLLDLFTQRAGGNVRLWIRQAWDAQPGQINNFVVTTDLNDG